MPKKKTQGEILRDRGMKQVLANSGQRWREGTLSVIIHRAAQPGKFNFEDIEPHCGYPPHHPNAIGAVMNSAVRQGIIVEAGYRKARRPGSHARNVKVYLGKKFKPAKK